MAAPPTETDCWQPNAPSGKPHTSLSARRPEALRLATGASCEGRSAASFHGGLD